MRGAGPEAGLTAALPVYISLMHWTSPGLGGLPAWRDRLEESESVIAERGGRFIDVYVTLGRYDVVEIFEAPNDEVAYGIVLELARHGSVRTETLRAFTREEAQKLVRGS
ncbi:MAG TPA: GYD domain-containing protein [Gaiellaceae bacterium]|nr:GYD domain-containing protein [Gaiellaceae bacterium]